MKSSAAPRPSRLGSADLFAGGDGGGRVGADDPGNGTRAPPSEGEEGRGADAGGAEATDGAAFPGSGTAPAVRRATNV